MDKLRDFLQSWPGRIVMLLCLSPMVFLGLDGYFHSNQLSAGEVAKVGETSIMMSELQAQTQSQRATLLAEDPSRPIDENALLNQTLQTMIDRALIEEQARVLGMQPSDATITAQLQNEAMFQDSDGRFSNELFAAFLQSNGLTRDALFALQRREINLRDLMGAILNNIIYPDTQVRRLVDLQLEARPLWVKRLSWQDYADQVALSNAQIDEYYNTHQAQLMHPEMVDLAYIVLPHDETVSVDDGELKQAYQARYAPTPQLAQILISDNSNNALQKAQKALQSGEDFASVAKTYSQDPTGQDGGHIGSFNPAVFGDDAAAVSAALTGLQVGQVSQPVQTAFGTHLFQVTKVADAPSFAAVKETLLAQVQQEKQQAVLADKIATANNMAVDGYAMTDIAKTLNVPIQTLKDYSKTNPSTLNHPAIIQAAFDDHLYQEGLVSGDLSLPSATVWLQPSNHRPRRAMTQAEAVPIITQTLTKQQAIALAYQAAQAMIGDANPSAFDEAGVVTRQSPLLNDAERASLFLHKADNGNAVWATKSDDGASVLIGGAIQKQTQERMTEAEKRAVATTMQSVAGQDYLQDYLQYLRSVHSVQINDELLGS